MRRFLAVALVLLPELALAQGASIPRDQGVLVVSAAPTGSCTTPTQIRKVASTGAEYWCSGGTWTALPVSVASGSSGALQSSNGSGGLADSGVTATAGALTAKQYNGIRYANQYATGGAGTTVSPWTGWETAITTLPSTGGSVVFPKGYYYTSSPVVIPYDGVSISGEVNVNRGGVNNNGSVVHASGTWSGDAVFKGTGINGVTIRDLKITGTGTTSANAILAYGGNRWTIENVFTDQFTGPCVYLQNDGGSNVTGRLSNIWAENCVKGTSLAAKTGAIQVEWTDTYIDSVTGSTSSADYSESGKRVGILLAGSFNFMVNSVGHLSEDGIALTGTFNRVSNSRADLNRGNGFVVTGGSNAISNSLSMNNSQQTDNAYDGFYVATGTNNTLTGNTNAYNLTNKVRYAFNDASGTQANVWIGNYSPASNYSTSEYSNTSVGRWFGPSTATGFAGELRGSLKVGDPNSSTEYARLTFPGSAAVANFGFSKSNLSWAFDYDGTLNYSADPFVTSTSFAAQSFVLKPSAAYSGNRVTVTAATPSAAQTATFPDASGTVVLDPNVTPPTTAAGYYQSGDSQGLQFFPGARRSYAEVLSLKQRGESPNQAPTSVRVFVLGDSISAMSTRSALRTWDKRFRLGGAGFDPLDSLTYAGAPEIATRTISGWTTLYGTNGGGETAPTTQLQMGIGGGSLFQSGTTGANVQVAYALTKVACNKIRIWYAKFAGAGAFQWRRDGGAWTTVATANASTDAGYVQVSLESTPIAGHTIDIGYNNGTTGQPGGNGVYIYGIESYTDYTGGDDQFDTVVPVWMSHGGATASRWASYVGSNQILTTFFTTVAPTQGFIALGTNDACTTRGGGATNDCTAGDSATTFSTNMQTIITALTSYLPKKTDIVLQSPFARGYDDCTGEMATFATRIDGYRTALFALATTNGVSVWDMRKYWPGFTDANALGMYNAGDCTHPHYWSQALISSGWADLFSRAKGWQGQEQWRQARNCDFNNVGIYGTATIDMGHCDFLLAAGNGTLGTINTCSSDTVGRRITIGCQSGATWTAATPGAGNVKLHSNAFTCGTPASQYASISFICSPDGFRWIETGRSKGM